jgi:carboxyl-terminal processing protease
MVQSGAMSRTFKRAVFAVSILLVALVFLGGMGPSRVRADSQQDGAYPEMEVYSEVLKKVQTDYVVDPNMTKVTVGALHGLLESLDPNSSYLTPEEYNAYKARTNEGVAQVGLNISKRGLGRTGKPGRKRSNRRRRYPGSHRGTFHPRNVPGHDPSVA